jgi:hypothetical protein
VKVERDKMSLLICCLRLFRRDDGMLLGYHVLLVTVPACCLRSETFARCA